MTTAADEVDQRCTCCDLPVSSCGKKAEAARATVDKLERARLLLLPGVFEAKFGGPCSDCPDRIEQGEPIRSTGNGYNGRSYVHAEHAVDKALAAEISLVDQQPAPPGEISWVLAASRVRYEYWCHEHGINPNDRQRARYVLRPANLRHLRLAHFVLLPGWEDNSSYRPTTETRAIVAHSGRDRPSANSATR